MKSSVDIVLPVHNEEESIGPILREFHSTLAKECPDVSLRFIVCEDGSRDNTVPVLKALTKELPLQLITSPERKGYSKAVIDGLAASTAPWVLCIDSDGQCDPSNFKEFWKTRLEEGMVVGYRNPRNDPWSRLLMSAAFKTVYKMLFDITLKDPSCPYILIHRKALSRIQNGNLGILQQGFWWEFMARAKAVRCKMLELPVSHRARYAGTTRVYHWNKVPKIAYRHLLGLFTLRKELSQPLTSSSSNESVVHKRTGT